MSTVLIGDDSRLERAALYLNVSQQHLLLLLAQGKVSLDSLAAYKAEQQRISRQALQQLVDQAQELDMGY